ncbi:MAG: hypothetical protein P4L90_27185 [Rhodopila sp.]|nr:hypothetical protein [Rhodopila sp.]
MGKEYPLPDWPRGMREPLAAAYVGLSESSLRAEVKAGKVKPVWLTAGRQVYLREDLDAYLDRAAGRTPAVEFDWDSGFENLRKAQAQKKKR